MDLRPASPRWELFAPGSRLPRFLDEMFPTRGARAGRWAPAVDIAEDDLKYVITAELPGTAKDGVLTIELPKLEAAKPKVITVRG